MKIDARFVGQLHEKVAEEATNEAIRLGLRDTAVAIHGDAVRNSPVSGTWPSIAKDGRRPTGINKMSITAEVSGMGRVSGNDAEHLVDDSKLEAAVYGTSGYGGYLETGTRYRPDEGASIDAALWKMPPRPYVRPAMDQHGKSLPANIRKHIK